MALVAGLGGCAKPHGASAPSEAAARHEGRGPSDRTSHAPTAPFVEIEATIGGSEPLSGSLCLPATRPDASEGLPPVAVLLGGWGSRDRDGTVGPNKPLRDLAWGLAGRGVAAFRYDPPRRLDEPTTDEARTLGTVVVAPALAATRSMLEDPRVDRSRVVVVGHSVGALAAIRLAQSEPRVAGLVLMAAPTRPLGELLVDQLRYVAAIDGITTEHEASLIAELEQQARRVEGLTAPPFPPATSLPLGLPGPFWLDLREHPLAALVTQERRPMLVLHAGRDYQVTGRDLAGWKPLLAQAPNAELRIYPSLNHLFLSTREPSSPTEYREPGHVATDVVVDLARWIRRLPMRR